MEQSSDLSDIAALVAVVETGSFSRAAERLGISKSIVSRRVARLEAALGARLLTRSAQRAGRAADRCRRGLFRPRAGGDRRS